MRKIIFAAILLFPIVYCRAQVTEFKKGWSTELGLTSGGVTNFKHSSNDLYVGGLNLTENVTLVPGKLKAGGAAHLIYFDKKFQGLFGPQLLYNIKTLDAGAMGSIGNIHLSGSWLFGTEHEQLVGGGIHASLLNLLTVGLTAHRDYKQNTWWFQAGVSFRISKVKKVAEPFNAGPTSPVDQQQQQQQQQNFDQVKCCTNHTPSHCVKNMSEMQVSSRNLACTF